MQSVTCRINPKKAGDEYNSEYLLSLILDISEEMLTCGAEVNRVEDTLMRLCTAYQFQKINVFAITEFIFVSFLVPDGQIITQTRRIYSYSNDLSHLEDLNTLSRYICASKPGVTDIHARLESLNHGNNHVHPIFDAVPLVIGSAAFTVFFGGNGFDAIASALIASCVYLLGRRSTIQNMNRIAYTVICSAMAGALALLLTRLHIGQHADKVMIGNIMLLIPGMALTNSIRDLLCGDIVAGLLRLVESLLVALAIAAGYSIPLILLGGI